MAGHDDEAYRLPLRIDSLDEVGPVASGGYVPAPEGGFELHFSIVEDMEKHGVKMAERRAEAEVAKNRLIDLLARIAIRQALAAAGANPQLAEGAGALLRERLKFQLVEPEQDGEDYAVEVESEFGLMPVADAVANWLAGDAGAPFRPKPKPGAGRWSEAMRRLH